MKDLARIGRQAPRAAIGHGLRPAAHRRQALRRRAERKVVACGRRSVADAVRRLGRAPARNSDGRRRWRHRAHRGHPTCVDRWSPVRVRCRRSHGGRPASAEYRLPRRHGSSNRAQAPVHAGLRRGDLRRSCHRVRRRCEALQRGNAVGDARRAGKPWRHAWRTSQRLLSVRLGEAQKDGVRGRRLADAGVARAPLGNKFTELPRRHRPSPRRNALHHVSPASCLRLLQGD
mmetsp:Transcript_37160/g.102230  ORF Transcript_37160/g.102230 Transcript_37160/m.102230 type:complete len:231 (-) Transcript_37160:222-914(-)